MSDEKDQIVAYLRRRARRYAEATKAPRSQHEAQYLWLSYLLPNDSIASALHTLAAGLKEEADAIERDEHRKENEE